MSYHFILESKGAIYKLNYGSKDNKHFIQFSKQLSDGTYVQLENSEGEKKYKFNRREKLIQNYFLIFIHAFSPKFKIDRASLNNEEHINLLLESNVLLI